MMAAARARWAGYLKRVGLKEVVLRFSYERGLPAGLEESQVATILRDRGAGHLVSARFRKMSGWKRSGAYRVVLKSSAHHSMTVVFKDARYSASETPALAGLPVTPGAGEFLVYDAAPERVIPYLPNVLLAEESSPRSHYRYVLEDLSADHHTCVGDTERRAACAILPDLHAALGDAAEQARDVGLIRFDRDFDSQLLAYASRSLETYRGVCQDAVVHDLLSTWTCVVERFERASAAAHQLCPLRLIHGDYNTSNVMIGRSGIKILDWEWLGFGFPHTDLVTILDGASENTEETCLADLSRRWGHLSFEQDRQIYQYVGLQRALLNASFVAKQFHDSPESAPRWLPKFVSSACRTALRFGERLE